MVVVSLAAQWLFGAWWIDSVGSLAIVWFLVRQRSMVHRQMRIPLLLIAAPLLFAANAETAEKEPSAIVEIGTAGDWGLKTAALVSALQ